MKSPAVLIAERDELLCRDLKGLLFHHGFQVIEAPDRTDIFQLFLDTKPDLVIIGSSPANAWDELKVAEQIRQRDREIPLILITRHSSEARVIGALRAGVSDYFKVPFLHRYESTPVRYAVKSGGRITKKPNHP
jgi:DNA-binding NtrC family response regulator